MITIQFLAEWAIRSSILILCGALLLQALRVKDSSIRSAAWTVMLCGSLAIPLVSAALPKIPVAVMQPAQSGPLLVVSSPEQRLTRDVPASKASSQTSDWRRAAVIAYLVVAGTLLLRLAAGLTISRRLLRSSQPTGLVSDEIDIRESDRVAAPLTLGIVRPAILLPMDWREWDTAKLDAVLAHERSHIRRHDPAVQLLSAIHRALMWHSPLSWFLHRRIVRVAEEASDDAVVLTTCDRASYAEILLDFMQRGMRGPHWHGVAMARYGRPDDRINRILDEPSLSKGMTRWSMAAILALASPLAFLIATAHPQARQIAIATTASTPPPDSHEQAAQATTPPPPPAKATTTPRFRRYMIFSDDSRSGSWDSRDSVDEESLKARFGREFVWLRQGGHEYVVTDAGVLAELRQAMEPQREVNRQQGAVNVQQGAVNVQQGEVNRVQGEVNSQQGQVNRRQEMINRLQSAKGDDDLIKKMSAALAELQAKKGGPVDQESVNRQQAHVNELQARVNEEQQKVNQQQHEVNEQQRRVSAIFNVRIDEILDSALRRNLAQQLN